MDALLGELGKQGILGLLLAITLTALFIVVRLLLNEKDKRIQDAQKIRDDITQPLGYIKDSLDLMQQKITYAKQEERK